MTCLAKLIGGPHEGKIVALPSPPPPRYEEPVQARGALSTTVSPNGVYYNQRDIYERTGVKGEYFFYTYRGRVG